MRSLAFSPNNSMLASGGFENLIIWTLQQDQCQIIKSFSLKGTGQPGKQNPLGAGSSGANYGVLGMAAAGSGQSGNHPLEENSVQKTMVQEINWSHD